MVTIVIILFNSKVTNIYRFLLEHVAQLNKTYTCLVTGRGMEDMVNVSTRGTEVVKHLGMEGRGR